MVDFNSYNAMENGISLNLSSKEFDVLHYLWNNKNKTVSRDELLTHVWEMMFTLLREQLIILF